VFVEIVQHGAYLAEEGILMMSSRIIEFINNYVKLLKNGEEKAMQFADFVSNNPVFTTSALLDAADNAPSAHVALSRAVKSGKVLKIRSGLYASQVGRFQGSNPDPFLVATTLCQDAVFAYHSALVLHGLAHSASSTVQFLCANPPTSFSFQGIAYKGMPARPDAATEVVSAKAYGTVRVTTREQTLVDCMARPRLAGGIEEVVRSFAGLPYADIGAIMDCLKACPPSVAARIGWYLEANQNRWHVPKDTLAAIKELLPRRASYKLDSTYKRFCSYSATWQLSLPAPDDEISSWMEM
jgi:predicted transcriptional regulator of viral defense system